MELHDLEAVVADTAAEGDPPTGAGAMTDDKAVDTETIEAVATTIVDPPTVDNVAVAEIEDSEAATGETAATGAPPMEGSVMVAETGDSEAVTDETVATDAPPMAGSAMVVETEDSEAETAETVATDAHPMAGSAMVVETEDSETVTVETVVTEDKVVLNVVERRMEVSVAPKANVQAMHTIDHPGISEHHVRLNAKKIERT